MIELKESGVILTEEHRYFLEGKELQGITGMIHKHIFPDMYASVPQAVLERAAERGKMVHGQIELHDMGFELAEMSPELENYKRVKSENNLTTVANEYIVTDGKHFASGIDLVLTDGKDNIILADVKTTSLLNKDYVRWQLSVYAYLFELQNKKQKVGHLFALWLKGDKYEFVELERIDKEIVKNLLSAEAEGSMFVNPLAKTDDDVPAAIKDAELAVYTLIAKLKELEAQKKELSQGLLKLMQEHDVKTYKGNHITLSRKAASTREDIDKTKLKADFPEAYNACMKITIINESLTIR